jgi:hypothetical protein
MTLQWILNPWFIFTLLTGGIAACLCLFFSLKLETRKIVRGAQSAQLEMGHTLECLTRELEAIAAEIRLMQERVDRTVTPPLAVSGLNLNKRGLALRMHRRGESAGQIANALTLPEREVELLLKVQQVYAEAAQKKPIVSIE